MLRIVTFLVSMTVVIELAEEVKIQKWIQCIQLQHVQQQAVPREAQAVLKVSKRTVRKFQKVKDWSYLEAPWKNQSEVTWVNWVEPEVNRKWENLEVRNQNWQKLKAKNLEVKNSQKLSIQDYQLMDQLFPIFNLILTLFHSNLEPRDRPQIHQIIDLDGIRPLNSHLHVTTNSQAWPIRTSRQ